MSHTLLVIDAFTNRPFAGNPAAVCVLDKAADEAWMKRVAREMNLSETAFLHPIEGGFALRWFTPAVEVKLCGHATLASAFTLWETVVLRPDEVARFHTLSGWLTCHREGDWIVMDFPAKVCEPCAVPAGLEEALGRPLVWCGLNGMDYLIEVADETTLRALKPNFTALAVLPVRGVIANIRLIERQRVVSARVTGADGVERDAEPGRRMDGAVPKEFGASVKLVSLIAENLAHPGERTTFKADVFIDATYEGDVAALAGVPYRVGRESRGTFGEPHAGVIYARFGDRNPLPGSTGAADDGIQAFCFRFHLTKNATNSVPVEKPAGYQREDSRAVLDDIRAGRVTKLTQVIQFYAMPNGKFEVNSDHPHGDTGVPSESLDLAEENWSWPEANPADRARIFAR